ncbi:ABC transporter ATP-binding protein [Terrilactibacillus laevilacticus]|uniref:ATP-binding cassette domain-containing protein n=1 Tax=Terrilactibacillus laevilacticus TaxID=1380157 RepID=A0ABW5PQA7_9BACI|nr:ATP-binding cassette domain-containing protein [Terrilactibacillus laevilacticus]
MIIDVSNLVKRYNDFLAIDHMSLQIKDGEIFGLLGPNGAGKTTLTKTLLGLCKYDSGSIKLFGSELIESEKKIKERIGLVPQDIAIYDELTAIENVQLFGKLYGLSGSQLKAGVKEALEFTGLYKLKDKSPSQFSGGMKRRLNIACAIVHKPDLLIMDEPTVGIDPQSRNYILESVNKLNKQGCTIIYISHYMEEVAAICSQIAIVDKGRIIAQGTKEELAKLIEGDQVLLITVQSVDFSTIEKLEKVPMVKDITLNHNQIRIISSDSVINQVMNLLISNDVQINKIVTNSPSLEDVFLTLTGRALREESN